MRAMAAEAHGGARRAIAVMIAGAVMAVAVSRCEGPAGRAGPPSMVVDGAGDGSVGTVTIAWDRGTRIYVEQVGARKARAKVVLDDPGLRGRAEIVRLGDGYLVMATHHHPEAEKEFTNRIVAVPLDRDARVVGEPSYAWSGDVLCDRPVSDGTHAYVGAVNRATSHRHPFDDLDLYELGATGEITRSWHVTNGGFRSCTTALRDGKLALAYLRYDHDAKQTVLWIVQDAIGQRTWLRAVLPASARALRVVPYEAGFAALVEEAGATEHEVALRILVLSADGDETRIESSRVLVASAAIDPFSSDLGTNARGLFVTYTARGRARVLGVEPRGVDRGHDTGPRPSRTRALGVGNHCLVAWTTGDGARARVAPFDDCP